MPWPLVISARSCARAEQGAGVAQVHVRYTPCGHGTGMAPWVWLGVALLLGEFVVGEDHGRIELPREVVKEIP